MGKTRIWAFSKNIQYLKRMETHFWVWVTLELPGVHPPWQTTRTSNKCGYKQDHSLVKIIFNSGQLSNGILGMLFKNFKEKRVEKLSYFFD